MTSWTPERPNSGRITAYGVSPARYMSSGSRPTCQIVYHALVLRECRRSAGHGSITPHIDSIEPPRSKSRTGTRWEEVQYLTISGHVHDVSYVLSTPVRGNDKPRRRAFSSKFAFTIVTVKRECMPPPSTPRLQIISLDIRTTDRDYRITQIKRFTDRRNV